MSIQGLKSILLFHCLFLCTITHEAKGKSTGTDIANTVIFSGSDTCLKKKFSVVFYVIQDSAMTLTPQIVSPWTSFVITELNTAFSPICISFVNCSTVYIPHNSFNGWETSVDNTVTGNWYTEKTINVYIVDSVKTYPAKELGGYTHAQNILSTHYSPKDVIVLSRVATPTYTSYAGTVPHTMGHLFGLHDTFAEISIPYYMGTQELVDGTNCSTTGDGICDTSADPFPLSVKKDQNNQFYTPPEDNYMSMYGTRCRFTPQQYYKMAKFILKHKMYLH